MLGVCKRYRARGTCCKRAEKEKEPAQVAEMVGLIKAKFGFVCVHL